MGMIMGLQGVHTKDSNIIICPVNEKPAPVNLTLATRDQLYSDMYQKVVLGTYCLGKALPKYYLNVKLKKKLSCPHFFPHAPMHKDCYFSWPDLDDAHIV